ncbi:ABC transporter permease [Orrella marina]|uniref:ABC transporter permease n=1 Tax=Orrella marina TaxID=2163011 RepID=A0A2R4XM41_9BURK|nr:ABC transporter permease [Orrella marina]AWB34877.1 ABC transporter permease [Orrella marina]
MARQIVSKTMSKYWPWTVLTIVVVAGLLSTFGLTQDPYAQDFMARNQGPGADHWLGTDQFGRDLLARLMAGAWLTLGVSASATAVALAAGAGIALFACRTGGLFRQTVFTVFDLLRTLPAILVGLVIMTAMGAGTLTVILAVGLTFAPLFAYITSATYDRERVAGYAVAARLMGGTSTWVAWRHMLPNMTGALITQIAIVLPRAITTESVLSFLGVGVAPDIPTWGRIIAAASDYAEQAPWSLATPVLILAGTTLTLSVIGHRLRDTQRNGDTQGSLT